MVEGLAVGGRGRSLHEAKGFWQTLLRGDSSFCVGLIEAQMQEAQCGPVQEMIRGRLKVIW